MTGEVPSLGRGELRGAPAGAPARHAPPGPRARAALPSGFDDAGLQPDDLNTLADLARFPFTTKADLRDDYPFGMFAVPREQVARVHACSGTTGKPTVVGYTQDDIDTWAELMARSIRAAGGRPGDVMHVAYGYGLFTGGLGAHYGAERLGCTVIPVWGGMTERQVQLIHDFEPRIIMVDPVVLLGDPRRDGASGHRPARAVRSRSASSAPSPGPTRCGGRSRSAPASGAVDIYGLSEVIGPGVAQECVETKDGLHIWEDHFYPEVIDPVTCRGAAGRRGGRARLHLADQAGDAGHPLPHPRPDPAAAGHGAPAFRRMEKITGRTDDMMIVRGVNVFPTQIEEQILTIDGLAPHYVCVLTRPGRMDELTVQVEAASEDPAADLGTRLEERIKQRIGVTALVEVFPPHGLERSLGKAKRISDRRQ